VAVAQLVTEHQEHQEQLQPVAVAVAELVALVLVLVAQLSWPYQLVNTLVLLCTVIVRLWQLLLQLRHQVIPY
jgi:hypothetical protein